MSETAGGSASQRGFCVILSSPSGAGKTTLAKALLAADPALTLSVSVTTRPQRSGERHGHDYIFMAREDFPAFRDNGGLIEWAEVFGNFYGTPAQPIRDAIEAGEVVICDVDWQGARSIAQALPADTVLVFILPPSKAELERRLRARASEPLPVIERRLNAADSELSHWNEYTYVLVHDDVMHSLPRLQAIIAAEKLKTERQRHLPFFVGTLMSGERPK